MTNEKLLNFIRTLREKSEANKLIAFVGSGVSRNVAGMPSWYELIVKMANIAKYSKCETCNHKKAKCKSTCSFKEEYTPDEYLKIPQYVANKNKREYLKLIKNSFPVSHVDAPLSNAIFGVHPAHIITTNYDNLLETSSNFLRAQYDLIIKDADLLTSNKNKYIIKMHGDLNDINSIVLKESDYLNYSQNHILIETFIKALLTDHTLLFLGYSLSDYNIKLIISWINFMRSQNNALCKNGIGYLVSCNKISKSEEKYFKNNGIEIIYIKDMPLINNIPSEINSDHGKRLYSFLKVIAEPNLETTFDYKLLFKDAVHYAVQFSFVDLKNLMKLLYINDYTKQAGQLKLYNEADYRHLYEFLNDDCYESFKLKQLLINAGIGIIFHQKFNSDNSYTNLKYKFYEDIEDDLYKNDLFCLYLQNRYIEIAQKIETNECSLEDSCFYMSIIDLYDESISQNFSKIIYDEQTIDRKVAYLLNSSTIRYLTTGNLSSKDLENFINNCNSKTKNIFSYYLNLLHGDYDKKLSMSKSLEKLQELYQPTTSTMGGTLGNLYEIQNYASNQYRFYFFNRLIFRRFNNLPNLLLPYIEAILCTNGEHSTVDSDFLGIRNYEKQKYELSQIDFDVITKFCDIKTLKKLLNKYNVENIACSQNAIKIAVIAFKNIADSVVELKLFGSDSPALITLVNYGQLLLRLPLTKDDKILINQTLVTLFSNSEFVHYLYSHMFPDNRISVNILSQLIACTIYENQFSIIKNILEDEQIFKNIKYVGDYATKELITSFICKIDKNIQKDIALLIRSNKQTAQKILIIFILMDYIDQKDLPEIKAFLQINIKQIDFTKLYSFLFNGWVEFTYEQGESIVNSALKNANAFKKGSLYPNPTDYDLELIYILFINELIKDITRLQPLSKDYPHLQFLLDAENFDYTTVDFSDYMWQNFARTPKLLQKFIAHKDGLTPKIKKRITLDEATEFERKIYYKYLLSDDDIWKN